MMGWKPKTGRTQTPCETIVEAAVEYTTIFLREQVEWLIYFGIVKGDDDDNSSEPPQDAPPPDDL